MNGGNYAPDTFTERDVLACLDAAGLKHGRGGGRYILTQCPFHEDKNPSAQIYTDDWFVKCHAGCEGGRFHITKAFPELRQNTNGYASNTVATRSKSLSKINKKSEGKVMQHEYKTFDQMEYWETLPLIPRDHQFKTIPLEILDDLGWRWVEEKNSYYIPYFSRSKESIPFSQLRHLSGERRFTFLKDAKPTCYGTWNVEPNNSPLFVCEGASDAAVLDYAAAPWVALPSASSGELMKALAGFCKQNGIELVYAGDNDSAGDKLREALDSVMPYRVKQPPRQYKDWGDFLVAEGIDAVRAYCDEELFPPKIVLPPEEEYSEEVENVLAVFPGAQVAKGPINDDIFDNKETPPGENRKEQSSIPAKAGGVSRPPF